MKKLLLAVLLIAGAAHAENQSVEKAKALVAAKMKDPGSVQFLDVVHAPPHGTVTGDIVCGRVNAKNSFGGYVGYRRFVSFGSSAIVEGEGSVMDDLLKGAWKECEQFKPKETNVSAERP